MAFPSTMKVEIEWVTGSNSWSDITTDVDFGAGISIHYGRTDVYTPCQPATLTLQLWNTTGKYTPGTQLLADGVTAHPNYPNVLPRRRIRYSYVVSATTYYRYYGYIRGFPPQVENGIRPYVTINAVCRLYQLGQHLLRGWMVEEANLTGLNIAAYYPMSDPQPGASAMASFADTSGNNAQPLVQPSATSQQPILAGAADPMPQSEGLTGASFQVPSGSTVISSALSTLIAMNQAGTAVGFWVTFPATVAGATSHLQVRIGTGNLTGSYLYVDIADTGSGPVVTYGELNGSGTKFSLTALTITTGVPHYIQLNSAGSFTATVAVDETIYSILTVSDSQVQSRLQFRFNQTGTPAVSGPIVLGPVVVFVDPSVTFSVPSASNLYQAGTGWAGNLTGATVQKLLNYAGLGSSDYSISTGQETLSGEQTILGRSVLDCCQDIVVTEGAGSVIYTEARGLMRWTDRNGRTNPIINSASMFVDAVKDMTEAQYSPAFDDTTLINSSTVTRTGGGTFTYNDTVSQVTLGYGQSGESFTSYASTDSAAVNLAEWRVAAQAYPQPRFGQLSVAMLTAENSFYDILGGIEIGAFVQVNSMTPGQNWPSDLAQLLVEGWTETVIRSANQSQYLWVADTSQPPFSYGIWDNTSFGRFSPDPGTTTLNASITAAATTLAIARSSGREFSTTSGDYPQSIIIGTEVIQLNSVPGGSTSPQTFTGVSRAQSHTRAAAQTAGSVVQLWPGPVWGL